MRMRAVLVLASVVAMVGMLWGSVRPAQACSHVAVAEAIRESDAVVAGYITQIATPEYSVGPAAGIYAPARVRMRVDRVLKGNAGADPILTFDDFDFAVRQISYPSATADWLLTSGEGCLPALVRETSLLYVIVGLEDTDDGYQSSGESWLFVGEEPAGDAYEEALLAIESRSASDFPWVPAAALAILGPVAFLAGATFVWRRGG